jgi:hypothetical protein
MAQLPTQAGSMVRELNAPVKWPPKTACGRKGLHAYATASEAKSTSNVSWARSCLSYMYAGNEFVCTAYANPFQATAVGNRHNVAVSKETLRRPRGKQSGVIHPVSCGSGPFERTFGGLSHGRADVESEDRDARTPFASCGSPTRAPTRVVRSWR